MSAPHLLTSDYLKSGQARAVPGAYFASGGWWLPPSPDPDSARVALRIFPSLHATNPELVATARLSAVDFRPIDRATALWRERPESLDPWGRVLQACLAEGIRPREFQRVDAAYAIDRLNSGVGIYLGHAMGLGKSLSSCMIMDGWGANFVFIACPNSAKHDPWVETLRRFCPWIEPVVVGNTAKARATALATAGERLGAGEPTALICHYEAVALIEGDNKRGWKGLGRWDLKIADEAHQLKSRTARRTAAFRRLDAVGALLLSGSVMSGAADKLFVPFQLMQPKRYRSQWRDWNDRFLEVVDGDFGRIVVGPQMHRLAEFRDELGESLVVRLAADHLNMPAPHVKTHRVKMTAAQASVYARLSDELLAELPDGEIIAATDGAPLVAALRRVTACAGGESAKLDRAVELIESAGDSQVLVFTWHKEPGRALCERLAAAGIGHGLINGDQPAAARTAAVDVFKRGGTRVLVATIATLSTAVNLQNAGVVILVEESFDPADNAQAIARVVRQGQTAHASVHTIRAENTVDELRVLPAALSKAEMRRLILGVGSTPAA